MTLETEVQANNERLSSKAKWGLLAAVTLLALAIMLAAAEVAVRVRQMIKYGSAAHSLVDDLLVDDPRTGLRVPRASHVHGRVRINSLGFRGPEVAMPKPAGMIRVGFLGASTTMCYEVSSNEMVWPHIVTDEIKRSIPEREIDYVNAAVGGYRVEHSIVNLKTRLAPTDPDVIVIYHAANDLSHELRRLAVEKGFASQATVQPHSWISNYSLLLFLAEKNWRLLEVTRRAGSDVPTMKVDPSTLGEPFRRDLTALIREAKTHAKLVAVATFSTRLRAGQSREELSRGAASALYAMPFMDPEDLIGTYARYNVVITEVAAAEGVVLIEGEDEIPADERHFNDTVHFKDVGSQAMATRVAKRLVPAIEDAVLGRR